MTEDFLHYLWKHQLFNLNSLKTDKGEKVEIIFPGSHNTDAGPDFSNARIRIDTTIWAGNVEIHTDSGLWTSHNHNKDEAYDNVILHVVSKFSRPSVNSKGYTIPTVVINFDDKLKENYAALKNYPGLISCNNEINQVDKLTWIMWLENLRIERLEQKSNRISELLRSNKGNWEECLYVFLATAFGMKTNALPFEMLSRSTPLKLINKYNRNLFQLEALLFGQAGFLETADDDYARNLQKEYLFLAKAHKLSPIEKHLWKFMRLRPANFPTIRISQFANLIHHSTHLFSKILETTSITTLQKLLNCNASDYWVNHYTFGKISDPTPKRLGKSTISNLIINTIIPFIFVYGKERKLFDYCDLALKMQEQLPPENNKITRQWSNLNLSPQNSAEGQALIQLTKQYCSKKNCLYCQVGNTIIQNSLK